MTEIVVAGSRQVDPAMLFGEGLEGFIIRNASCAFQLRCGVATTAGPLELAVAAYCEAFEVSYSWWIPDTRLHVGRKAVW